MSRRLNKKSAVFFFAALGSLLVLSGCSTTEEYESLNLPSREDFIISQSTELTAEEAEQLDTQSPQITFIGYDGTSYSLSYAEPVITEVNEDTTHVRVAMEHNLADYGCNSEEYEEKRKAAWEENSEDVPEGACNNFNFGGGSLNGEDELVSSLINFEGASGRVVYEYDIPSNERHTIKGFILNAESEGAEAGVHEYNLVTNRDISGYAYFNESSDLSESEKSELESLEPQYNDGTHTLTIGKAQQNPLENGNVKLRIPVEFNLPVECGSRTEEEICHTISFKFGAEYEGYWDSQESFYPADYVGEDFETLKYHDSATGIETEAIGSDKVELALTMIHPDYEETTVYNVLTGEQLTTDRENR